ncbi:MAG: nucleotidyltransferase family protein [Emcibacteraceae bacterium]|nr:nucleotidyltransferase family protein [Emcibacteraceae bacterium]
MHNLRGNEEQIIKWISDDPFSCEVLEVAKRFNLPDWCLAAGFVRNLIWDKLHGFIEPTPLNDIDFIYYDPERIDVAYEKELEHKLNDMLPLPWSIKNQARMHLKNKDMPYQSTSDAMSYWVEVETAIGASVVNNQIKLMALFGVEPLFNYSITINKKRPKTDAFHNRLASKKWLEIWPKLKVL